MILLTNDGHGVFINDAEKHSTICDDSRTLVGKANDKTALMAFFNVDMAAMGAMMEDPEFNKLTENYVEEHIPFSITPLNPPS